jgi:hypothetical protein
VKRGIVIWPRLSRQYKKEFTIRKETDCGGACTALIQGGGGENHTIKKNLLKMQLTSNYIK